MNTLTYLLISFFLVTIYGSSFVTNNNINSIT